MRDGRSRRWSSRARQPASTSGACWKAASHRRSIPASRTAVPASARSVPASLARRSPASRRRSPPSPMLANRVERGRYLDSVALMRIARRLTELPGVEAAALMIGTPSNKALLADARLLAAQGQSAEPNDLLIAVRAPDPSAALALAARLLNEPAAAGLGGGVSHGIGVGGRDLDERVGALGMLAAIEALEADAATRTLVLISKPPTPRIAQKVLERVRRSQKRAVVCFLGEKGGTLTEAAEAATGRKVEYAPPALPKRKGAVRGLYCGGTLASEAALILRDAGAAG